MMKVPSLIINPSGYSTFESYIDDTINFYMNFLKKESEGEFQKFLEIISRAKKFKENVLIKEIYNPLIDL